MREKLIELNHASVREFFKPGNAKADYEEFHADFLIANGVTIQKWIPVTERLPEDALPRFSEVKQIKVLVALKSWNGLRTVRSQMRYRDTWGKEIRWMWKSCGGEVTHWMPLPEPPKGE